MTRGQAWLTDFGTALAEGATVYWLVRRAGGARWAALGFGLVVYWLRPPRAQEHWLATWKEQ